jgi:hypothetical protein
MHDAIELTDIQYNGLEEVNDETIIRQEEEDERRYLHQSGVSCRSHIRRYPCGTSSTPFRVFIGLVVVAGISACTSTLSAMVADDFGFWSMQEARAMHPFEPLVAHAITNQTGYMVTPSVWDKMLDQRRVGHNYTTYAYIMYSCLWAGLTMGFLLELILLITYVYVNRGTLEIVHMRSNTSNSRMMLQARRACRVRKNLVLNVDRDGHDQMDQPDLQPYIRWHAANIKAINVAQWVIMSIWGVSLLGSFLMGVSSGCDVEFISRNLDMPSITVSALLQAIPDDEALPVARFVPFSVLLFLLLTFLMGDMFDQY